MTGERPAVLAAFTGAAWEAEVVALVDRQSTPLTLLRRCVDVADLLAAAAAGTADVALVAAELLRFDRESLVRLRADRVAVLGVVAPGDDHGEQRLRQIGVNTVIRSDAAPDEFSRSVQAALSVGFDEAPASELALAETPHDEDLADRRPPAHGGGKVISVWGPAGAPGRSTVAVNLAAEIALSGDSALLVDADTYGGGAVAQLLGLLDESPGLAAAARAANTGALDLHALAKLATLAAPDLRVLTGISRAARWTELRQASVEHVLNTSRSLAAWTVVDCGFSIEVDEELVYDTAAPRRNGATLAALEASDVIVAVGGCDPVSMARLVRALADLRETVSGKPVAIVVNRVRATVAGRNPQEQAADALVRFAGVESVTCIPEDLAAVDEALRHGRVLADVAPRSSVRAAIAGLATGITGLEPRRSGRRLRRRAG